MITNALPQPAEMMRAFMERDAGYDGLFYTGVTTTGIFCVASCSARKPRPENIRFFRSPQEAITAGFRACQRCRPLQRGGEAPAWIAGLLAEVEENPRISDRALRERGLDPARVRRWFMQQYGMSFQAYQRSIRLGRAFTELQEGTPQTRTAFESGYESLSGFRSAYQRTFGTTPGQKGEVVIGHMKQIDTPLGTMLAICTPDGVRMLEFLERRALESELRELGARLDCTLVPGDNEVTAQLERELAEYFAGQRRKFDVPLQPIGTPFQQKVWQMLLTIPYGETRSYLQQAQAIGQPSATRAVARANGDNKIAVIIPCHRVIGANGKLTGYGGGLWRKQHLLDLERGQLSAVGSGR